jgi:hypothetical protein
MEGDEAVDQLARDLPEHGLAGLGAREGRITPRAGPAPVKAGSRVGVEDHGLVENRLASVRQVPVVRLGSARSIRTAPGSMASTSDVSSSSAWPPSRWRRRGVIARPSVARSATAILTPCAA